MKILLMFLFVAAGFDATPDAEFARQRDASHKAVQQLLPDATDKRTMLGAEVQRLIDEYKKADDDVLYSHDAPIIITSEAESNISDKRTVSDALKDAKLMYPELEVAGSAFQTLFTRKAEELKAQNDPALKDTRWPIRLAIVCASEAAKAPVTGALPVPETPKRSLVVTTPGQPLGSAVWSSTVKNFLLCVIGMAALTGIAALWKSRKRA